MKRFEYIKELHTLNKIYRGRDATLFETFRFYLRNTFRPEYESKHQVSQAEFYVIEKGLRYTEKESFLKNISRKGWLRLFLALPILPLFIFSVFMSLIFTSLMDAINDYYFEWLKNTFGD